MESIGSTGTPTLSPPAAKADGTHATPGMSKPTLSGGGNESAAAGTKVPEPTMRPPGAADTGKTAGAGAITGTWTNGSTVNAMWGTNEIRNAWMSVVGVGWVKIFNGTDGAFTALSTLAAQARQTGRTINYRVEADGMAHEIYLW